MENFKGMTKTQILYMMDTQWEKLEEQDLLREVLARKQAYYEELYDSETKAMLDEVNNMRKARELQETQEWEMREERKRKTRIIKILMVVILSIASYIISPTMFYIMLPNIIVFYLVIKLILCFKKKKVVTSKHEKELLVRLEAHNEREEPRCAEVQKAQRAISDSENEIHDAVPFIPWGYCNREAFTIMYGYVKEDRVTNVVSMVNLYRKEYILKSEDEQELYNPVEELRKQNQGQSIQDVMREDYEHRFQNDNAR